MSDPISIAPHLQRALTAMSKDMAIEPQAIVNQAVFAWLRLNGYVLPGVAGASEAPVQVAAPVVAAAPVIAPMVSTPTPPPVAPLPALVVVAPPPVIASTPTPVPEVAPALVRMAQIDADLEKLTKPWPAWSPVPAEEEEEEEQAEAPSPPEDQQEEEPEAAEEENEEEAPPPDEEISEKIPAAAAPPDEEPGGNTGETEMENAGESTIVLRSAPIALYLERAGEEPIKVTTDRFIIGRGPHCDMVIDSPRVSREHVALTRKGVVYYLEDLSSSNGTWFGEERVTRRELESGDVISLGNEPVTCFIRAE